MENKRRKFKPDFKAKVALEAVKERKTLAQLAQDFSLHPNQISQWKQTLVSQAQGLFEESKAGKADEKAVFEVEKRRLFEQIGKLQMELEWLKKKYQSYQE
jgi:transposase-like protein